MLPAFPTGIARTSGARPRSSQISNAAVFWPSRRNGLTELTSVTGWSSCSASPRTMWSAWSKLPSMATTRAPAMSAWPELAQGDLALGQDHDDLQSGVGAVRRGRRGRVAGRRADDGPRPGLDGLGDGHDHPAVLERPGRVLALDLEVQVRGPDGRAETLGVHERRRPLAEGQRRGGIRDRQEPPVPLHQPRPGARGGRHRVSHRRGRA